MPKTRLVLLFGGQSAEHEVSCVSARHVLAAVDPKKYEVVPIGIAPSGQWQIAERAMELFAGGRELPERLEASGTAIEPAVALSTAGEQTVVFPVLHGPFGEDGTVQGLLELADVPYIGPGVLASAVAMDKSVAKELFSQHGLPQAKWIAFKPNDRRDALVDRIDRELGWPVFVKPANMGSSVGISKVKEPSALDAAIAYAATFDEQILVEEFVNCREIELSVLGNELPEASVPGEIIPGGEFYDYADKYLDGRSTAIIPADLPAAAVEEVQALAKRAFVALRCEGMARCDFFYEQGGRGFLINEINTIPGFTPISMYPKLWEASGLSYSDLIDRLVSLAVDRHERRGAFRRVDRG